MDKKNVRVQHVYKEEKNVAFPKQSFYLSRSFATKEEKRIGNEQIHMISSLNDCSNEIDSRTKTDINANNVKSDKVTWNSIFKYGAPP